MTHLVSSQVKRGKLLRVRRFFIVTSSLTKQGVQLANKLWRWLSCRTIGPLHPQELGGNKSTSRRTSSTATGMINALFGANLLECSTALFHSHR